MVTVNTIAITSVVRSRVRIAVWEEVFFYEICERRLRQATQHETYINVFSKDYTYTWLQTPQVEHSYINKSEDYLKA